MKRIWITLVLFFRYPGMRLEDGWRFAGIGVAWSERHRTEIAAAKMRRNFDAVAGKFS